MTMFKLLATTVLLKNFAVCDLLFVNRPSQILQLLKMDFNVESWSRAFKNNGDAQW